MSCCWLVLRLIEILLHGVGFAAMARVVRRSPRSGPWCGHRAAGRFAVPDPTREPCGTGRRRRCPARRCPPSPCPCDGSQYPRTRSPEHCSRNWMMFDICVMPAVGLWQVAQPIELNNGAAIGDRAGETCCPFSTTPPGGGGARNPHEVGERRNVIQNRCVRRLRWVGGVFRIAASGEVQAVRGQPCDRCWSSPGSGRSCVNSTLLMPISTL